jgi:MFS family permease
MATSVHTRRGRTRTSGAPTDDVLVTAGAGFRWFFAGRVVFLVGSSLAPVALAFAVLDLIGHASGLGIVLAARSISLLLFVLLGGAVADRFPRRLVLLLSNTGAGLTQGAVAALFLALSAQLGVVAVLELANGSRHRERRFDANRRIRTAA